MVLCKRLALLQVFSLCMCYNRYCMINKICNNCNTVFKSNRNNRTFCGQECYRNKHTGIFNDYYVVDKVGYINFTNNIVCKFSLEDLDKVNKYRWYSTKMGYIHSQIKRKDVLMHHLIVGRGNKGTEVDHINRIRSDNRKENLRIVSLKKNRQNRGIAKNNSSGCNGVSWCKRTDKWVAYICVNSKQKILGRYLSIDKAIKEREIAEMKYWGFNPVAK